MSKKIILITVCLLLVSLCGCGIAPKEDAAQTSNVTSVAETTVITEVENTTEENNTADGEEEIVTIPSDEDVAVDVVITEDATEYSEPTEEFVGQSDVPEEDAQVAVTEILEVEMDFADFE